MAVLNTETETKDLDEAIDFVITCVQNICDEHQVSLTDEQMRSYAALVISNNFDNCATQLYSEVIPKLFNFSGTNLEADSLSTAEITTLNLES